MLLHAQRGAAARPSKAGGACAQRATASSSSSSSLPPTAARAAGGIAGGGGRRSRVVAAVTAPRQTSPSPSSSSPSSLSPEALAALPPPPKGLPPGFADTKPPSLVERALSPLGLSDMAAFVQRPAAFLADRRAAHGPAFTADNIIGKPTVFLFDEADVRRALAAEHRLVEQRWPKAFAALLGPSFQGGKARHAFHRRAMGAAFTAEAIAAYQPFMQQLIARRLEKARLAAEAAERSGQGDGTYAGWSQHMIVAFDVAASLLLGFEDLGDEATGELHGLFRTFVGGFVLSPPVDLPFTKHGKALAARRRIVELLSTHLEPVMARVAAEESEEAQEAQAAGASSSSSSSKAATTALRAFLTARDDDGRRVSIDDAKEMVLFTAFAGHETTGTSISQAVRLLDGHRRCWHELVEEQRRVVRRHGPELTAAAAAEMPYADAVARETLRLCPVVRFVWREALEDFEIAGGTMRVPAGHQVVCSLAQPTDDIAAFVADRHEFRPERWLLPAAAAEGASGESGPSPSSSSSPWRINPAPNGFLPFGAGGRVCIGMPLAVAEMRAFLAVLARGYEFEVRWPGGEAWDGKASEAGFLPPGGMPVKLTPRALDV